MLHGFEVFLAPRAFVAFSIGLCSQIVFKSSSAQFRVRSGDANAVPACYLSAIFANHIIHCSDKLDSID